RRVWIGRKHESLNSPCSMGVPARKRASRYGSSPAWAETRSGFGRLRLEPDGASSRGNAQTLLHLPTLQSLFTIENKKNARHAHWRENSTLGGCEFFRSLMPGWDSLPTVTRYHNLA